MNLRWRGWRTVIVLICACEFLASGIAGRCEGKIRTMQDSCKMVLGLGFGFGFFLESVALIPAWHTSRVAKPKANVGLRC